MKRNFAIIGAIFLCLLLCCCKATCTHEYDSKITVPASCGVEGTQVDTCRLCGHETSIAIPALQHAYDNGAETKSPTCTQEGTLTFTCSHCGDHKTDSIDLIAHNYVEKAVTKEPSCTEEGIRELECELCHDVVTESIELVAHTFGETYVTKEATCAEEGELSATCEVCNTEHAVETIAKTDDHVFENTVVRESTCSDPGEGVNNCTVCGHSESCTYELKEHTFDSGETVKDATCASAGLKKYTCADCGHTEEKETDKKSHKWKNKNCTDPAVCSNCGAEDADRAGHDFEKYAEDDYNWFRMGERCYKCSRCGEKKTEYFGKHGDYDLDKVRSKAEAYAKSLGFHIADRDDIPSNGVYNTNYSFKTLELEGGDINKLIEKAKSLVDYQLDVKDGKADRYDLWVVVQGGGSSFYIYVCVDFHD